MPNERLCYLDLHRNVALFGMAVQASLQLSERWQREEDPSRKRLLDSEA